MSLTSFQFVLFLIAGLIIYYVLPKKLQWIVLLGLSFVFYINGGLLPLVYIGFSILTVWLAALLIDRISANTKARIKEGKETLSLNDKKQIRKQAKKRKQQLIALAIVLNIGILFMVKYYGAILDGVGHLWGFETERFRLSSLIMPLGLSFYTFQSIAYLLDVYWEKITPEKNLARYALFISFFPQVIQGPIGRYDHLGSQLKEEHDFELDRFESGLVLMLWGFFKKMVIANRLALLVNPIFDQPGQYSGCMIIVALLAYSVQQYCDFAGGIDVITGVAELFGIRLQENFKRPYFSRSLSEFWRRWHISLGAFMRDYVFYPLAMTKVVDKACQVLGKRASERGKVVIQMAICNIVVFLLVGIWHGPELHYVVWGLYNGIVIAIGAAMEPVIQKFKDRHQITDQTVWFAVVSILWTFAIVNFGWFFDRSVTVPGAFQMIRNLFTNLGLTSFSPSSLSGFGLSMKDYAKVAYGVAILFAVSLIEEVKGISVRDELVKAKMIIRWPAFYILIFTLAAFAMSPEGTEAFMYAQF